MRPFLKTLLLTALVAIHLPASAQDVHRDAMALTIDHFNARHTRDVTDAGPEFRFMVALLRAVGESIPELEPADATAPPGRAGYHEPHRFLSASDFMAATTDAVAEAQPRRGDVLRAAVDDVVAACPYRKSSTISEISNGEMQVTRSTTTVYELGTRSRQQCAAQGLTDALAAIGLNLIVVKEDAARYGTTLTVYAGGDSAGWRYMRFVKSEALRIEGAETLFSALDTIRLARIGENKGVQLIGSSGAATFTDPVKLRYEHGWGDCPAGCIHRHFWVIRVKPTATGGGAYDFAVTVEQEGGDSLPGR
ncbi:hypothetical protein [Nitrogeniibacter aestuarii]|uniref:hypothetical protein n=1 Tax=Nitrogeniibacter aestuarii TaxID=2815343 RepID=UPI001D12A46E|nr:hypothetical protein [Nitrogeniibacter aestuarii]